MTSNVIRCLMVLTTCLAVFANSLPVNLSSNETTNDDPYLVVHGHRTRVNTNSISSESSVEDGVDGGQKTGLWANLVSSVKYAWNNLVNDPISNESVVTSNGKLPGKDLAGKVNLSPTENAEQQPAKFDLWKEIAEAQTQVDALKALSELAEDDENELIKKVHKENPGAILDGLVEVLKFGPLTKDQVHKYKITLSSLSAKNVDTVSSEVVRIKLIRKEIVYRSDGLMEKIKHKLPNPEAEILKTELKKLAEDNGLLKNLFKSTT